MHCQSVVSEANTRTMSECLYAGGHVWGHLWVASVPSECRCPRWWCHHCLSGTCLRDSGWEPSESGLCDHGSDSCIVSRHVPLPCRLPRQLFLLRGTFPGVPSWTSTAFLPSISAEDGKAPVLSMLLLHSAVPAGTPSPFSCSALLWNLLVWSRTAGPPSGRRQRPPSTTAPFCSLLRVLLNMD